MASRAQISATVLFTDLEDYRSYLRWQLFQDISQSRHGFLPTALEYKSFLSWSSELLAKTRCSVRAHTYSRWGLAPPPGTGWPLPAQGNGEEEKAKQAWKNFEKAKGCEHPLHPAHRAIAVAYGQELNGDRNDKPEGDGEAKAELTAPMTFTQCPVCTIRTHLTFVQILQNNWAALGGPWQSLPSYTEEESRRYFENKKACHMAKVDMINCVHDFETWAEAEEAWEQENLGVDVAVTQPYSAREALQLHQNSSPSATAATPQTPAPQKRKKKLVWSPDTPETTRGRPNGTYNRNWIFYEANGIHACDDEKGWVDVSYMHDPMFTISQCRILRVWYDEQRNLLTYNDLNAGISKSNNDHVVRLQGQVMDWLQTRPDRAEWMKYLENTTDIFLVMKKDWRDAGDDFDCFEIMTGLVGTGLESYARSIGDIDDETEEPGWLRVSTAREVAGNAVDYDDQESLPLDPAELPLSDPVELPADPTELPSHPAELPDLAEQPSGDPHGMSDPADLLFSDPPEVDDECAIDDSLPE